MNQIVSAVFVEETPAGALALAASGAGLAQVSFCSRAEYEAFLAASLLPTDVQPSDIVSEAERQIMEYFSGSRRKFDLPLDLAGQTPFRLRALKACAAIPFGQVRTYGEVAALAGSPGAARASGGAMANNPLALVIPCHRVVGSDRGLHGFSSPGGLQTKALLLRHEGLAIREGKVAL